MRLNLAVALLVSIVLIGGATLLRVKSAPSPTLSLEPVSSQDKLSEDLFIEEFLSSKKDTGSSTPSTLAKTDLISRQLFTDYINLSSNGQATPKKLDELATSYTERIFDPLVSTRIERAQVLVIPDSALALTTYNSQILALRDKYKNLMTSSLSTADSVDVAGTGFSTFMVSVADLYKEASEELKAMPVPSSLADIHVKLINNYTSSGDAARTLSNIEKDPINAYSAIATQANNAEEETSLLSNIQMILLSKGITPTT